MDNRILNNKNLFQKETGFTRQTRPQLKQKIKNLEKNLKQSNHRILKLEGFKERLEIQNNISNKIAEIPGVCFKASHTHYTNINEIMFKFFDIHKCKDTLKQDINDYLTNNMSFVEIKQIGNSIVEPNKYVTKIQALGRAGIVRQNNMRTTGRITI